MAFNNTKGIVKQYNILIKCLLGVWKNASVNLHMLEAGIPPLDYILNDKRTFLLSKRDKRNTEEPLCLSYAGTITHLAIGFQQKLSVRTTFQILCVINISDYVRERAPTATKFSTYVMELNPSLYIIYVFI